MVALADLQKANLLSAEANSIRAGLRQFDQGAIIVAMTIGQRPPPEQGMMMPMGVQVSTAYMTPPQQMMDTIKQLMQQRQSEIEAELQQLGVTGVGS